jgi:protein PhnA
MLSRILQVGPRINRSNVFRWRYLAYAQATGEGEEDENKVTHRDSNGVILEVGDSVVLIKDLKVKGSSIAQNRELHVTLD